jgi:hypothetical protein
MSKKGTMYGVISTTKNPITSLQQQSEDVSRKRQNDSICSEMGKRVVSDFALVCPANVKSKV